MRLVSGLRLSGAGASATTDCAVAEEAAVAFSYNGFPHAVMMVTPADLEDLAVGFSVTEGIVGEAGDISGIEIWQKEEGVALDIALVGARFEQFLARRRRRALRGHTSCGLCGVEDLADLRQDTHPVAAGAPIAVEAVRRALASLRDFQPLGRDTGAMHAAA